MNEITHEQWKPVVGYEENYLVSNWGRIWSIRRLRCAGGLRKQRIDKRGYHYISLCLNGVQKSFQVHRLVMAAFAGPCPEGMEVRHLDGDPHRNVWPDNLEYATHEVNMRDKRQHGTDHNSNKEKCPKGHEYDDENTAVYNGSRYCKKCARANGQRIYWEQKAANPRIIEPRDCGFCGTSFTPKVRSTARFCSHSCASKARARDRKLAA